MKTSEKRLLTFLLLALFVAANVVVVSKLIQKKRTINARQLDLELEKAEIEELISGRGTWLERESWLAGNQPPFTTPVDAEKEMLAAAGALSMATVGAVALVGESVLESGKAVLKKGTHVTADIVRHRHGDDAGQIVSDVFESTGNVLSITRTSFQATHISKAATKNIAKMHLGGG